MTKEELKALGLTDEQADKVIEGYKAYVPKSRFDEVNEAKKKAESTVAERDKQLKELKESTGDVDAMKAKITKLQEDNKAAATKYAADLKALQVNNAVERALSAAGAKNNKAVKALLTDLEKAELDGEEVKGLADQIKKLKEGDDTKFLFGDNTITGAKPGQKKDGTPSNKKPEEMTYSELAAYMNSHPDYKPE